MLLFWISTNKLSFLQNSLKYRATHDELTGLYNRSYLVERLKEELALVKRSNNDANVYESVVILIDIDFFKKFNDDHGHLFGDEVLKEFSSKLKDLMRQEDVLGRYGGEEFLTILPSTHIDVALI